RELVGLYGVPPEKIQVAPPPADTERFFPQPGETAALRAKYGFADHETVFLFPSTGHTRKGLELLADFFEHTGLPVKLAVAGSPLPRTMKNVVGLGFCTDMPELYRAADFTIMASLYEPFGLVGVESVLCGTRVVLSDNMACTEVMNEEAGFFFSRQNPETLAQAVAQAVSLKKQGGHRLSDPMRALNYNPALDKHIGLILEMLAA
ncbi:glycosyltransferase, partial [Neisseria lactamica]